MKESNSKKKRHPETQNAGAYILTDNQVTALIWGEVARMKEEIVAGIHQTMQDALRDDKHPFAQLLREVVREELAKFSANR